jgi:hypothetical protein
MAESFPTDPPESGSTLAPLRPIADIAGELTINAMETYPLAAEYIGYLDLQDELRTVSPEDQIDSEPYYARAFVHEKTVRISGQYRRSWQKLFEGRDSNGRPIDVDAQIGLILHRFGSFSHKIERFGHDGVSERARHLENQANFTVQPEHYYRFPEILGAARLAEELWALGHEALADSVDILIAAQGATFQKLPAVDKRLPAPIVAYIRQQHRPKRDDND